MKTRSLLLAGTLLLLPSVAFAAEPPRRLTRAESFLGIHFDFHAGPNDRAIGANTTPAMIEQIITRVRPDYLQIDCKGHPGWSSYPTQAGNPVPGIVGDPLRTWREVTAARGVGLFMHYSGVWDTHAAKDLGWAAVTADGKPSERATSFWSPYRAKLLVPQLRELAGSYGVDGAWVDGDCWAVVPDYRPEAIAEFQTATGVTTVPRRAGEPHWAAWLDFHREAFRRHLRTYLAEVKQTHPAFQLCSNWAFTDHMPEPVTAPVDFLSGDYAPDDSVNSARLAGRYLARQLVPWDLMAWSFSRKDPPTPGGRMQKTAVQLQREAAVVLALGGGFQAYFKQKRDGSIHDDDMLVMAEVAQFCRERQTIAHRSRSVPQVALLLSRADQYQRAGTPFGRSLARASGVLQALLESQASVDVVGEHHLAGRCADYPLIVVPECDTLDPKFRDELAAYARDGGSLLLVGPGSVQLFARELGATFPGGLSATAPVRLTHGTAAAEFPARWQPVQLAGEAPAIGRLLATGKPAADQPAATIIPVGRGRVGVVTFTAGQVYAKSRPPVVRDLLATLVRDLFPDPIATVTGSTDVDVTVARNHGKLLVHLVNTSGPHATQPILETIAPVGPLDVTVRVRQRPARIMLEPGGRPIPFTYTNGRVRLSLPSLGLYDILVLESR